MMQITDNELIKRSKEVAKTYKASEGITTGEVGCALVTEKNNVYIGISIHACCGIGFCAEHSAIASMVTNREYKIKKIVAVTNDGIIIPPCGRCREMIYQINNNNLDTKIIIGKNKIVKLEDLLPEIWQKNY